MLIVYGRISKKDCDHVSVSVTRVDGSLSLGLLVYRYADVSHYVLILTVLARVELFRNC